MALTSTVNEANPLGLQSQQAGVVRKLLVRGVVLLSLLAGIKVGILLALEKHLFHAHYRINPHRFGMPDWINFFAFLLLLLGAFFCLGRHAKTLPVRTIR